jgi:hypothetical protein
MTVTIAAGCRIESWTPGAPFTAPNRPGLATVASGDIRSSYFEYSAGYLGMELAVVPIVMHRLEDLGKHVSVPKIVKNVHNLAVTLAAIRKKR